MLRISLLLLAATVFVGQSNAADTVRVQKKAGIQPDKDNAGLKLPAGFSAITEIGRAHV